jgi:hypothetical protein
MFRLFLLKCESWCCHADDNREGRGLLQAQNNFPATAAARRAEGAQGKVLLRMPFFCRSASSLPAPFMIA